MALTSPKTIKELLKKYQAAPLKRFGQNFLVDQEAVKRVIEAANLQPNDIILEIGPGTGILTRELAKKIKKVIAIEKDQKMIEILKETLKDFKNVEIIQADIRKFQIQDTKYEIQNTYKVVGNLPFYLTAPVIRQFLETENSPKEMVFIVQKEVAQRICPPRPTSGLVEAGEAGAKPPRMNLLAVSVQFYAKPEIVSYVPKESFWPTPKVDGAILKISAFNQREKSAFNQRFFEIVRAGFSQPRKQLINNLSRLRPSGFGLRPTKSPSADEVGGQAQKLKKDKPKSRASSLRGKEKIKNWLLKNGIQPSQRAETLKIQDWKNLTKTFSSLNH